MRALKSDARRLIWNLLISVDPPAILGKPEWHYELTLTLVEAAWSIVMDIMVMVSRVLVQHLVSTFSRHTRAPTSLKYAHN